MIAPEASTAIKPSAPLPKTLSAANKKTLVALFRHPTAHNLEWTDVVALISTVGEVDHRHNNDVTFWVAGQRYLTRKPHGKDLLASDVIELRTFVRKAYGSPDAMTLEPTIPHYDILDTVVAIDHHGARFYNLGEVPNGLLSMSVKPDDPYHVLHHLTHKDQTRKKGQRAPEDPSFYQRIAQDLLSARRIILVGHGKGKSNAAHQLANYLDANAPDTFKRVIRILDADLSHTSSKQLLDLARASLGAVPDSH